MGELLKLIQNLKKNFTTDLKKLITFIKDYNGDDLEGDLNYAGKLDAVFRIENGDLKSA